MTQHPFQLTAPFSMTVQPDTSGTFQVVNTGTQPLAVRGTLGRYSHGALKYPAASHATTMTMGTPWVSFTPAHFTLAPGHAETIRVTDHVPAGAQGEHFIDLVWTASPVRAAGGPLHLSGAVASTVGIPLPGVAVPVAGPGRLAAPHPGHMGGSGLPVADLAGGVLVPVLLAVAGLAAWRRRRHGRRAAA
jgi:hypothetical protein